MRSCTGQTIYSAPIAGTKTSENQGRGERLKELWESRPEISQKAVAAAAGVTPARVREWEKGAGMYADSLEKLAAFYGVEATWLETGDGDKYRASDTDPLDGLHRLEVEVKEQGRALGEIKKALAGDPRWPRVEDRLNFLSDRLRRLSLDSQEKDEEGESQQWSPIDLTPGEPIP